MAVIIVLLAVATAFALAGLMGAPYVPILRRDHQPLLNLLNLQPGQTLVDLGSGDGQLLRAAAARGIRCIGYEINPIMVLVSRLVTWRYRHLVTIRLANLWRVPLPPAAAIYVFLLPKYMARLNTKLTAEIRQPTLVASYVFELPGRQPVRQGAHTLIYRYP